MNYITQLENPTHYNSKKERKKALKALEEAKKSPKKAVYVPKGFSQDFEKFKKKMKNAKN